MKIEIILLSFLLFVNFVYAQNIEKMSDVEFAGLKGKVKTVKYESIYYGNLLVTRKRGEYYTVVKYGENGDALEKSSFQEERQLSKTTIWKENDYIFERFETLYSPLIDGEEPLVVKKTGNKLPESNPELETKSRFIYDKDNNRAESFFYHYDIFSKEMKLYSRMTFEYDSNRSKIKETIYLDDGTPSTIRDFAYNEKMLIKEVKTTSYDYSKSKDSYIYVKIDNYGNWLERKVFYQSGNKHSKKLTLSEIEYQTITYY